MKSEKKQKRSVLLSEIMVAFFLFSLLLTSLTVWFHSHLRSQKTTLGAYHLIEEEHAAVLRCRNIFDRITTSQLVKANGEELFFIFNRGISLLSEPRGIVQARFFLEKKTGLLLLGLKSLDSTLGEEEKVFPFLDGVLTCEWKAVYVTPFLDIDNESEIGEDLEKPFPPIALELQITRKAEKELPQRLLRYMFEINVCPPM